MKKTKPEPRSCPECGEKVGLSADSVRVHLRLKHPACALVRAAGDVGSGGGSWAEPPSPGASSTSSFHLPSPQMRRQPAPQAGAGEQPQAAGKPQAAGQLEPGPQLAALRTRPAEHAAADAEAEAVLPSSPASMAAVLLAEAGIPSLVQDLGSDVAEFLVLAASAQPTSPPRM